MKKYTLAVLVINLLWAAWLFIQADKATTMNYLYNIAYGTFFFMSAVKSFSLLRQKTLSSLQRKVLWLFGIAFVLFGAGQLCWVYYNLIAQVEVPYPGLADLFWGLFYPMIGAGMLLLLKDLKTKFGFVEILESLAIYSVIFVLIYSFLQVNNSVGEELSVMARALNVYYPACDTMLITLTIAALRSSAGRVKSHLLYFVFGFMILALADTLFSYQSSAGLYWNGNITDLMYAVSGFLITIGVIEFPKIFSQAEEMASPLPLTV